MAKRPNSYMKPQTPKGQPEKLLRHAAVALLVVMVIATAMLAGNMIRDKSMLGLILALVSLVSAAVIPLALMVIAGIGENIAAMRELLEEKADRK